MKINKSFTSRNNTYPRGMNIRYIVCHYTAGATSKGGTGANVCRGFSARSDGVSADFVVDDSGVWQYNPDIRNRRCGSVGGRKYNTSGGSLYSVCTNSNSVSIEMCSTNTTGDYSTPCKGFYFTDEVVENTRELVRHLMSELNIPAERVIRHFDVNGKPCPGIENWVVYGKSKSDSEWVKFRKGLKKSEVDDMDISKLTDGQCLEIVMRARTALKNDRASAWASELWGKAADQGIVDGTRPQDFATRQEIVAMIERAKEVE